MPPRLTSLPPPRFLLLQLVEQHRRADQRSTSFVGLVRDLNEIAGYCDKTAVRVVGAGEGSRLCVCGGGGR